MTLAERLAGGVFFTLYRLLGLLLTPLLVAMPRTRRHILGLPRPDPGWTWLHGASAGEHVAARALASRMHATVWRTRSSLRTPVLGAFPAPLDLPFVAARWLRQARPGRLVLIEAELWPGWLVACRRLGIPVTVVGARPGRGTARWRALGPLWRWLTAGGNFITGADTGELKRLAPLPAPQFPLPDPTFVAASTRAGDEERLLEAWRHVREPRPLLVLAPRYVRRAREITALISSQISELSMRQRTIDRLPEDAEVFLLDTIGELAGALAQARAAFIGGTFDEKIGGHSPAEAFAAGLPVVHGPHIASNAVAFAAGRSIPVPEEASPEALADAINQALRLPRQATGGDPSNTEALDRGLSRLPAPAVVAEPLERPLLRPLIPLWPLLASRHAGWSAPPQTAPLPVVSVGALVAGGSGKTPIAAWLAARIPGAWVAARGYRRGGPPGVRIAAPGEQPAAFVGDELEMMRRRGIGVVSSPDRLAAARAAAAAGATLLILDDGFQHRRLKRDLDIVCVDARHPNGGGPIPVGRRREPWSALSRADVLWIHNAPERDDQRPGAAGDPIPSGTPPLPRVRSRIRPRAWLRGGTRHPLSAVTGPVDVVVGIARPGGFLCTLVAMGLEIRSWRIAADHGRLGALPRGCVTTEKDAARLPPDADVWALEMALEVTGAEALVDRVRALAGDG